MSYDLYLVPNGRRHDFERGYTGGDYPGRCQRWGSFDTLEEARQRLAELVEEDLDSSGCYPDFRLDIPIPEDFDVDNEEQVRAFDDKVEKKKKELAKSAADSLSWELRDLQLLMVVKTDEDRSIWEICYG